MTLALRKLSCKLYVKIEAGNRSSLGDSYELPYAKVFNNVFYYWTSTMTSKVIIVEMRFFFRQNKISKVENLFAKNKNIKIR